MPVVVRSDVGPARDTSRPGRSIPRAVAGQLPDGRRLLVLRSLGASEAEVSELGTDASRDLVGAGDEAFRIEASEVAVDQTVEVADGAFDVAGQPHELEAGGMQAPLLFGQVRVVLQCDPRPT